MSSADENRGLLAGESLQQACFLPFSLWKTPQLHYGVLDCPDMCTVLLPQEGSLRTEKGRLEDIYIQPRTQLIKLASSLMWDFLIYSFTHLFFRKVYWVPSTQQALIQALEISIEWNSRVNEKKKKGYVDFGHIFLSLTLFEVHLDWFMLVELEDQTVYPLPPTSVQK